MERSFRVNFYQGRVGADGHGGLVSHVLKELAGKKRCPVFARGDLYEIRDLRMFKDGASFSGVFARLRTTEIPHIGTPAGAEREIDLAEEEGLLEKNHFLYSRKNELLTYQSNRNGCSVGKLGEYITDILGTTTIFAPVLHPEALRRIVRQDLPVTALEVSFARPTNTDLYPKDNWSKELLELMDSAEAARIFVRLSANNLGRNVRKRYLPKRLKKAMQELVDKVPVRVAKMTVEEDGETHPIDLIADRIQGQVQVEMDGRYPVPDRMFTALRKVTDDHAGVFNEIFGDARKAIG